MRTQPTIDSNTRPAANRRRGMCCLRTALISLTVGLTSFSVNADLLEYSFKSVDGQQRTLKPDARYANPVGTISLALNSGVDRLIRASIVSSTSDAVLSTSTSHIIGAGDRITVDGSSHYGTRLQLPAPGEGTYRIKAEIISSDGASVVQTDYYPVSIDTTPPALGAWRLTNKTFDTPYGWDTSGSVWHAGCESRGGSNVNAIERIGMDDVSGISSATAKAYVKSSGVLAGTLDLEIAPTAGTINAGTMCELFPDGFQRNYQVNWHVTDKAGNTRIVSQDMFWDSDKLVPAPYAVYSPGDRNDAGIADFKPYTPGMTVQSNPLKLLYKIPDSNWGALSQGGLIVHGYSPTVVHRAGGYSYYQFECLVGKVDSCGRFADQTSWGLGSPGGISVVLGANATVAPAFQSIEYNYSDIGWATDHRQVPSTSLPVTVNGIRVSVAARPYRQRVNHTSGTCYVEANSTSCVVPWTFTMSRSTWGYIHGCCVSQGFPTTYSGPAKPADTQGPVIVYKDDDTRFSTSYSYPAVTWNDLVKPSLKTYSSSEPNTLDASVVYTPEGGLQKQLGLKSVEATVAGKVFMGSKMSVSGDGVERRVRFDLRSLPDGLHPVSVRMIDLHENRVSSNAGSISIDTTPPTVSIAASEKIASLDDISISVTDAIDSKPRLLSIYLTGGPAKENVSLAWTNASSNTFKLEYPILFPSLVDGEEYRLVVEAIDAHGNIRSATTTFEYSPAVSVTEGWAPAAPFEFKGIDGRPVIYSEPLKLASGETVTGTHEIYATLRSDAKTSFYIGGKLIAPGQTVTLAPMNFTATGGRVVLPARPTTGGAVGINGVLISTSAPNTPVVVATINTWRPQIVISHAEAKPQQIISSQILTPTSLSGSRCSITTSEASARLADPLTGPVCLLQWTSIPAGLKAVQIEGSQLPVTQLQGNYQETGPQTAAYEIYLFSGDGTKRLIDQGSDTITVDGPLDSATFMHSLEGKVVRRTIDERKVTFTQTSSPTCVITGNEQQARSAGASDAPLTCLLEFDTYPEGLSLTNPDAPELSGAITTAGRHPLTWTASTFDAKGNKLVLQQGSSYIDAVHPAVQTSLAMTVNESSEGEGKPAETFPEAWSQKSYVVLSQPQHGTVQATTTGFHYLAEPAYIGPDVFTYRVQDSSGMYADGQAAVDVREFNYPPVVRPMDVSASRMVTTAVALHVEDANSWDSHTFEIVGAPQPAGVRATIVRRELHIEPIDYWHGELTLSYRAVDLAGAASEPETIRVSIPLGAHPPVVTDKRMAFKDNAPGSLTLSAYDIDSPPASVFEIVTPPQNVTATISGKKLVVTSNNRWHGSTSFTYRAQDDGGLWSEPATVYIDVTKSLESQLDDGSASMIIKFKIKGM